MKRNVVGLYGEPDERPPQVPGWLRAIFLAVVAGTLAWQIHSGMFDLKAVTTADLQRNHTSWGGRDVTLTNVTIKKYEIHEKGADTFVRMWIANGRTSPPADQEPVMVIARIPTNEARRDQSLPSILEEYRMSRLPYIRVTLTGDDAFVRVYASPFWDFSLFSLPYRITVETVNRFASLKDAVYAGIAIQTTVYVIVALLVLLGLMLIVPKFG